MIEEYEGIENDVSNARNARNATARISTTGGQELELWGLAREIMYQKGVELEGDQLKNAGVFRASSGNLTKRLKSRVLIRAEKSAKAAMRQYAAQERQVEKEQMKMWKENVMQKMTHKLHIIWQTHEEEMKAQRQEYKMKLEQVRRKLEQLKLRSKALENKVKALRLLA